MIFMARGLAGRPGMACRTALHWKDSRLALFGMLTYSRSAISNTTTKVTSIVASGAIIYLPSTRISESSITDYIYGYSYRGRLR